MSVPPGETINYADISNEVGWRGDPGKQTLFFPSGLEQAESVMMTRDEMARFMKREGFGYMVTADTLPNYLFKKYELEVKWKSRKEMFEMSPLVLIHLMSKYIDKDPDGQG